MTRDVDRDMDRYRFSGYHLPTIDLDGTGQNYVVVAPWPGQFTEPLVNQQQALSGIGQGSPPGIIPLDSLPPIG